MAFSGGFLSSFLGSDDWAVGLTGRTFVHCPFLNPVLDFVWSAHRIGLRDWRREASGPEKHWQSGSVGKTGNLPASSSEPSFFVFDFFRFMMQQWGTALAHDRRGKERKSSQFPLCFIMGLSVSGDCMGLLYSGLPYL